MIDTEAQLQRTMEQILATFFVAGAENRFSAVVEKGVQAYPILLEALAADERAIRVDALQTIGRLFETHGADMAVLRQVVDHSKRIAEGQMGPERQAALYAIGRSGERSLIAGFVPLLAQENPAFVNVALLVLGYARWRQAVPYIRWIAARNQRATVGAAIWALGQIGDVAVLDLLLPMLRRGENVEWIAGALGDLGSPLALEDAMTLLTHERVDTRFLGMAAIWAIVDHNKDRALRRELGWMEAGLRRTALDSFPPVAVYALMTLAALGCRISHDELLHALGERAPAPTFSPGSPTRRGSIALA